MLLIFVLYFWQVVATDCYAVVEDCYAVVEEYECMFFTSVSLLLLSSRHFFTSVSLLLSLSLISYVIGHFSFLFEVMG